jgi:hypothetical protein
MYPGKIPLIIRFFFFGSLQMFCKTTVAGAGFHRQHLKKIKLMRKLGSTEMEKTSGGITIFFTIYNMMVNGGAWTSELWDCAITVHNLGGTNGFETCASSMAYPIQ